MNVWTIFHAKQEPNSLVINSGCSNHMTNDRIKFISLKKWNGRSIKCSGEEEAQICGKGTFLLIENTRCEDALYVKGVRHNMITIRCAEKDAILNFITSLWNQESMHQNTSCRKNKDKKQCLSSKGGQSFHGSKCNCWQRFCI